MRNGLLHAISLSLVALVFVGCPDPKPPPGADGGGTTGPSADGATGEGDSGETGAAPAEPPADPLEGSLFSKEDLFEIYAAEQAGGDQREKVLRAHKLIDAGGQPIPARESAYERALGSYAKGDPEGWAAFVESLPR